MIEASALRRQAENKYAEVVESLLRGDNPFPLRLRYPRIRTTDSRESILRDLATLHGESIEQRPHGLTIAWTEINTVKYGRNRVPDQICLATEADFLGYIGKQDEMTAIRVASQVLGQAFPEIRPQLPGLWRWLREGSREHWQRVVRVVTYFRASPFPDRYARELPVEVPTKFIAEHRSVLEKLIEAVAPHAWRADGETFEERLGLKSPESLVECRLLDDRLVPQWSFRQFTVGINDLEHLAEFAICTVLITENRTNFLTLPALANTLAIQGQGYAVGRLRRVPFLQAMRIIYWGDLDAHGFEILAVLRRVLPQVESVMMDATTWAQFPSYRVPGVSTRSQSDLYIPHLRDGEAEMFQLLASTNLRLEQERIPQAYANQRLADIISKERP